MQMVTSPLDGDLTPDLGEDDHFNLIKRGSLHLSVKFGEALPQAVNAIVYAEFQNALESIATKTCFTISLLKHERTTNQTHFRVRCENKKLFSRCILSKRIANCGTYAIAVRLQHGSEPQTRRTLGDNLH